MLILRCFFIFFISLSSYAEEMRYWQVPESLSAKFLQKRYLKTSDITLESSGDFSYVKSEGIIRWNQKLPFENKIEISKNKIVEDGVEKKMNASLDISSLLYALFEGNMEELKSLFEVTQEHKNEFNLVPKQALMKKVITRIELKGSKYLESFEMSEVNGNFLKINFIDIKATQ